MKHSVLALVVLCLGLAGCAPGASGIVGKWEAAGVTIEFTSDGHLKLARPGRRAFTWYKVDGEKMTIGHLFSGMPDETVRFKVSGNTLAIGSSLSLGTLGTTRFRRAKGP